MDGFLQQRVLVLNRLWQAVHVCTVQRALVLLYTGHAQVVHRDNGSFATYDFEQWCRRPGLTVDTVHSVKLHISSPRVLLLLSYERLPLREVRLSRDHVFQRDRHTCQYCHRRYERRQLNIDHVLPRQRGGRTTWTNVVCSCLRCNGKKGNRTPEEAGMHLLRPPRKPHWRAFAARLFEYQHDDTWTAFLDSGKAGTSAVRTG